MTEPTEPTLIPLTAERMSDEQLETIGRALQFDGTYLRGARTRKTVQALYKHVLWMKEEGEQWIG